MKRIIRNLTVVAVFWALCLALTACGITKEPTREPGSTKGYFRDITNIWGAVVGTSYEQATNEICMSANVNGDKLTVLATFADPQMAPYVYAEQLGIAAYKIVDEKGSVAKEGAAESAEIVNGQAAVNIQLDDIDSGSYKLIVTDFVSEKKIGQPLNINGSWECAFTK